MYYQMPKVREGQTIVGKMNDEELSEHENNLRDGQALDASMDSFLRAHRMEQAQLAGRRQQLWFKIAERLGLDLRQETYSIRQDEDNNAVIAFEDYIEGDQDA